MIQGACVWGTICNASAGMGKVVADAYGDSPWAIFVRPDSKIRKPEDLKDVPIVGRHARRQPFQRALPARKYLPLEHIKTVNTGGFGARLKALLDGEVEAASLLPPQIAMAEQLGLRKIIEDTLPYAVVGAGDHAAPEVVRGYLNALDRAEKALEADLAKYLPLWKLAVPAEFENYHPWDFTKFGRGERFVYKRIPHEEFDETMAQVKRWGLDQHLKDKSFESFREAPADALTPASGRLPPRRGAGPGQRPPRPPRGRGGPARRRRRQFRRWSGVASKRRGNHASGAASSLPSARTTTIRSSVTVTSTAVASSLTGEMGIPCLQEGQAMLDYKCPHSVYLMGPEAVGSRQADRIQPKLGDLVAVFDVDMRRLRPFQAVEEEAESSNPQNCWHRSTLGTSYDASRLGSTRPTARCPAPADGD